MYALYIILTILLCLTAIVGWVYIGATLNEKPKDWAYMAIFTIIATISAVLMIIATAKYQVKTTIPPEDMVIIRKVTITSDEDGIKQDTTYIYKFKGYD